MGRSKAVYTDSLSESLREFFVRYKLRRRRHHFIDLYRKPAAPAQADTASKLGLFANHDLDASQVRPVFFLHETAAHGARNTERDDISDRQLIQLADGNTRCPQARDTGNLGGFAQVDGHLLYHLRCRLFGADGEPPLRV